MGPNIFSRFIHLTAVADEPDFDRLTAELLEREQRLWSVARVEARWAAELKPYEMRGTLRPRMY